MNSTNSAKRRAVLRQQEYKARLDGKAPPLPCCKSCQKQLKVKAGNGKAYQLGLCYDCYKRSPEYRESRRISQHAAESGVIGVGYWSRKATESELTKHDRLRAAIGYAWGGRLKKGELPEDRHGPVFVAWSDGRITEHHGLTAENSKGLQPDDPSALDLPPDNPAWFLDQIPEEKRRFFDWER